MKKIDTDSHVFVAGRTGSGKSFLTEVYLAGFDSVVKLDTKGEYYERLRDKKDIWRGLQEGKDFTVVFRLEELDQVETKKIIYVPDFEEQNQEFYNALFKWVYDRQNTTLWIDEMMSIAESPRSYPPYLKALMTRGRSRNSTVWSLSQRVMDIPSIVLANSTHFFIFDLNLPQDREKMVKTTGQEEFYEKPGNFYFWYYKDGTNTPIRAKLKLSD
jgi:hypothetical protein